MKIRHALTAVGVGLCAGPMLAVGAASAAPAGPANHATGLAIRTDRVVGAPSGAPAVAKGPINTPTAQASESTNWAGYADTGSTYKTVTSSWTQPTVTCSSGENSNAAFWVGLDGDGSQTVEQTGTDSDCNNGTPTYYAWYEFYNDADPSDTPSYDYTDTVKPGDQFTATSTYTGGTNYTETITDNTQGWTETTKGTDAGTQASAEVIAEAPSTISGSTLQRLPLSNFGKINFTGSKTNSEAFGSVATTGAIDMYNDAKTTEDASTSTLSNNTDFTCTWLAAD